MTTNHDQAHTPAALNPKKTALLIVDMQNGFVHPDSNMAKAWGTDHQQRIVPALKSLITLANQFALPVFWSKQIYTHADVKGIQEKRLGGHLRRQQFTPCVQDSWETEIIDALVPLIAPSHSVIIKHRASFFHETQLPAQLRQHGIDTVIVAGVNTEFCIETTVRDGYMRDYNMVVIEDCVASSRPQFHSDSIEKFRAYFAAVMPLSTLNESLEASP
jgi:ureidoacrylate peracid hydrolase